MNSSLIAGLYFTRTTLDGWRLGMTLVGLDYNASR